MSENKKTVSTKNFIAQQRMHCHGDTKTEGSQDPVKKAIERLPVKKNHNPGNREHSKQERREAVWRAQRKDRNSKMDSKRHVVPDFGELLDKLRDFMQEFAEEYQWFHGMKKNKDDKHMFEDLHIALADFLVPFKRFFALGNPRVERMMKQISATEIKKEMVRSMNNVLHQKRLIYAPFDGDKDNGLKNMLHDLDGFREEMYDQYRLSATDIQFFDKLAELWDNFVEVCKALHKMSVELSNKVPMMTENQIVMVLGKIQRVYQELRKPRLWSKHPESVPNHCSDDDEDDEDSDDE